VCSSDLHEKQGAPGKRLMLLPFSNTITDA